MPYFLYVKLEGTFIQVEFIRSNLTRQGSYYLFQQRNIVILLVTISSHVLCVDCVWHSLVITSRQYFTALCLQCGCVKQSFDKATPLSHIWRWFWISTIDYHSAWIHPVSQHICPSNGNRHSAEQIHSSILCLFFDQLDMHTCVTTSESVGSASSVVSGRLQINYIIPTTPSIMLSCYHIQ